MYPVLFRIGDFEVTSFGVLVAIGALVGLWIFQRELHRSGLPAEGVDAALAGIIGGLAGAKLLWVLEHLGEERLVDLLLSRGGMSWFGGFTGGVLAGLLVMRRKRLPKIPVLAAATPALAFGHLIGRIGCFPRRGRLRDAIRFALGGRLSAGPSADDGARTPYAIVRSHRLGHPGLDVVAMAAARHSR